MDRRAFTGLICTCQRTLQLCLRMIILNLLIFRPPQSKASYLSRFSIGMTYILVVRDPKKKAAVLTAAASDAPYVGALPGTARAPCRGARNGWGAGATGCALPRDCQSWLPGCWSAAQCGCRCGAAPADETCNSSALYAGRRLSRVPCCRLPEYVWG